MKKVVLVSLVFAQFMGMVFADGDRIKQNPDGSTSYFKQEMSVGECAAVTAIAGAIAGKYLYDRFGSPKHLVALDEKGIKVEGVFVAWKDIFSVKWYEDERLGISLSYIDVRKENGEALTFRSVNLPVSAPQFLKLVNYYFTLYKNNLNADDPDAKPIKLDWPAIEQNELVVFPSDRKHVELFKVRPSKFTVGALSTIAFLTTCAMWKERALVNNEPYIELSQTGIKECHYKPATSVPWKQISSMNIEKGPGQFDPTYLTIRYTKWDRMGGTGASLKISLNDIPGFTTQGIPAEFMQKIYKHLTEESEFTAPGTNKVIDGCYKYNNSLIYNFSQKGSTNKYVVVLKKSEKNANQYTIRGVFDAQISRRMGASVFVTPITFKARETIMGCSPVSLLLGITDDYEEYSSYVEWLTKNKAKNEDLKKSIVESITLRNATNRDRELQQVKLDEPRHQHLKKELVARLAEQGIAIDQEEQRAIDEFHKTK